MNIKKNFNYFIARIHIGLKENVEYKSNLYSSILTDATIIFAHYIFYIAFANLLDNKLLDWTSYDFFTYVMLGYFSFKFMRLFQFHRLKKFILEGDFNSILTKPINPYIYLIFRSMKGFRLFTTPIAFLILLYIIINGDYQNRFLAIFTYLFGCLYITLTYNTMFGLVFFIKENRFIIDIFERIQYVIRQFTPKVFEAGILFYIVLLFPFSITGYITLEILKNNLSLLSYVFDSIIIFTIFVILNFIIWHYGLKKYEAFG